MNPLSEHFFEDDGVLTIWASDMGEICIKVERGMDRRNDYAAFLTRHARSIATSIVAMADAIDEARETPIQAG
jgi:hypothetical protein